MPSEEAHKDQAVLNEKMAEVILEHRDFSPGWAVTILFYAARHLLEAYYARSNLHSPSHTKRLVEMQQRPELSQLAQSYRQLQTDSENARYECHKFTIVAAKQIRDNFYLTITNHIKALST